MSARRLGCGAALVLACLLTGCHHHAPVRAVVPPPPPPANAGPVMVSVPPPTHRSTDTPDSIMTSSNIPVVKPVRPPRRSSRRSQAQAPAVAQNGPTPPAVQPPIASTATPPALDLGQLTTSTDDPAATRDGAAQAIRRERDRVRAIPGPVLSAHPTEIDQARRFLKSASDSFSSSDYAAAIALTTKARVLLDDLLK
ncbi:hypothetical protein [Terriglobus sp.]|uniref:hypothetical protein n=1 Tax=Terriglobus sp. TaxID=1889013 RepID=UPI003B00656F